MFRPCTHEREGIRSAGDRRQEEAGHNTGFTVAIKRASCQNESQKNLSDNKKVSLENSHLRRCGEPRGPDSGTVKLEVRQQ